MDHQTYSEGQFWFCFLLMNIVFIGAYLCFKKKLNSKMIWGCIFLFCVPCYWNQDYFNFQLIYNELDPTFRDPLYYYIKQITFGSYHLFRAIIWGAALLLFYKTSKIMGIPSWIVIFVFPICFLLPFSYARASLAMASYFYGVTLLKKSNKISLMGLLFVIFSYFAHRSMLPLIVFTPLAIMRIRITNKFHLLTIIIIPILVILSFINQVQESTYQIQESSDETMQATENFTRSASRYLNVVTEERERSLKSRIMSFIHYVSIYSVYVYLIFTLYRIKKHILRREKYVNSMMLISTLLIVISVFFLYLSYSKGYPETLAYRYLYMTYIPLILQVSYFYQIGLCKKRTLYLLLMPSFIYAEGLIGGILYSRFL